MRIFQYENIISDDISHNSSEVHFVLGDPKPLFFVDIVLQLVSGVLRDLLQVQGDVEGGLVVVLVEHQIDVHHMLIGFVGLCEDDEWLSVVLELYVVVLRGYTLQERVWGADGVYSSEVGHSITNPFDLDVALKGKSLDWNLKFLHHSLHHIVTHCVNPQCGYAIQWGALKVDDNKISILPNYVWDLSCWIHCQRTPQSKAKICTLSMVEGILQDVLGQLFPKVNDCVVKLSFAYLTFPVCFVIEHSIRTPSSIISQKLSRTGSAFLKVYIPMQL